MLFLEQINYSKELMGSNYIGVIQGLNKKWRDIGTKWLKNIVDGINQEVLDIIPSFKT